METELLALNPTRPEADPRLSKLIDLNYEIISIGEALYYASEVLFAVDYKAYLAIANSCVNAQCGGLID